MSYHLTALAARPTCDDCWPSQVGMRRNFLSVPDVPLDQISSTQGEVAVARHNSNFSSELIYTVTGVV